MRSLLLPSLAVWFGACADVAEATFVPSDGGPASFEVWVPPGQFTMGDQSGREWLASPPHEVRLTRGLCIRTAEVRVEEWIAAYGFSGTSRESECADCPVTQASWSSALDFANWESARLGLEVCYELVGCRGERATSGFQCEPPATPALDCAGYRLPTEAEWEYFARADLAEDSVCEPSRLCPGAFGNLGSDGPEPVRSYLPNAWGIYDLIGNAGEWVWDPLEYYRAGPAIDPAPVHTIAPEDGAGVILRGGSWLQHNPAVFDRFVRQRTWWPASTDPDGFDTTGLRLVRTSASPEGCADWSSQLE